MAGIKNVLKHVGKIAEQVSNVFAISDREFIHGHIRGTRTDYFVQP
jgi:hypothetical protein